MKYALHAKIIPLWWWIDFHIHKFSLRSHSSHSNWIHVSMDINITLALNHSSLSLPSIYFAQNKGVNSKNSIRFVLFSCVQCGVACCNVQMACLAFGVLMLWFQFHIYYLFGCCITYCTLFCFKSSVCMRIYIVNGFLRLYIVLRSTKSKMNWP